MADRVSEKLRQRALAKLEEIRKAEESKKVKARVRPSTRLKRRVESKLQRIREEEVEDQIDSMEAPTPEEPGELEFLKGKHVMATVRDPIGRVKSFYTKDVGRALGKTSGELISIFEHTPSGALGHQYYYDKDIRGSPTIHQKELVSYIKSGREVPDWYKEQVTIPPEIKTLDLSESYLRAGFESQLFYRSPLFKYSGLRFEKKYKRVYTKAHKQTETGIDLLQWSKKKDSSPLYSPFSYSGVLSYIFMPWGERIEYTKQSLFGDPFGYKPGTREIQWKWDSPFESKQMQTIRAGSEYQYTKAWERGDWGTIGLRGASSPFGTMAMMYGLGLGMGALKQTAFGTKALLVSKGVKATGEPLYTITPSKLIEGGIVGYGVFETGKSLQKDPVGTVTQLAVTLPFIFGAYRAGAYRGASYVQKTGALSKVKGLDRTRQVGLYETIDISSKLKQPRLKTGAFDLTQIQRISPSSALRVSKYLRAEQSRWLFSSKPRFGGSTSTQMQLGSYFRTDTLPGSLRSWAVQRQTFSSAGYRPLIGTKGAMDIDLLVYSRLGGLKRASYLRQPHVIDVHTYKIGEYYWGGKTQMPSTKGFIYDPFGKTMKVSLLSPSEQFLRKSVSILPSESMRTGYRTYKDVPDWFDIGDVMSFQKGGGKLRMAMDKVIHPEKYPVPKVSFGERLIGRLGVKPFTDITPTGEVLYQYGSRLKYPSYAVPVALTGYVGYPESKYKSLPGGGYKAKDILKLKIPSYGGFPSIKKTILHPVSSIKDFSPSYPRKIYKKYKTSSVKPYTPQRFDVFPPSPKKYLSPYKKRKKKRRRIPILDGGENWTKLKGKRDLFDPKYKFRMFKFPGMKLPNLFKSPKKKKKRRTSKVF